MNDELMRLRMLSGSCFMEAPRRQVEPVASAGIDFFKGGRGMAKRGTCDICKRENLSLAQMATESNGNVNKCGTCYRRAKENPEKALDVSSVPANALPEKRVEPEHKRVESTTPLPPPIDPKALQSIAFHIPVVEQGRVLVLMPRLSSSSLLVEMLISDKLLRRPE